MANRCVRLCFDCAFSHASWPSFDAARLQLGVPTRRLRIHGLRYRCSCHVGGGGYRSLCFFVYLECSGHPEEVDEAHQKAAGILKQRARGN